MKAVDMGIAVALSGAILSMAAGASAQSQSAVDDQVSQGRYKLFVMEGVFERAVQNGAAVLSRQIRAIAPDAMFLSGAAHVRGFRLDGYGVFFDVEVPALRPTVAYTLRTMVGDNGASLAQLKAYVQKLPDSRDRAELMVAIRRLELQMPSRPVTTGDSGAAPQAVSERIATATATQLAPAQSVPAQSTPDPALLADPAGAYTREVKNALIDAMIENSGPLAIGLDEWFTVAARDSEPGNRLVPGDSYDLTTWVFRMKGSDLAAFRAGRLTLDEARHKVEIIEN